MNFFLKYYLFIHLFELYTCFACMWVCTLSAYIAQEGKGSVSGFPKYNDK